MLEVYGAHTRSECDGITDSRCVAQARGQSTGERRPMTDDNLTHLGTVALYMQCKVVYLIVAVISISRLSEYAALLFRAYQFIIDYCQSIPFHHISGAAENFPENMI